MSEAYKKQQYRHGMYDGNAAYDLDWSTEDDFQEQPEPVKQKKEKQVFCVSLGAVLGFALIACLFVAILLSYINYTEIAAETVSVRNNISELAEQNRKLTVACEQTFDINAIEVYAQSELKMSRPAKDQVSYISAETNDEIRVYAADDAGASNFRDTFVACISAFLDKSH